MSNYAKLVLWMGLFMILAGVIKNWSSVKGSIFTGSSSGSPSSGSGVPGAPLIGGTGIPSCPKGQNYILGLGCVKLGKGQSQCPQGSGWIWDPVSKKCVQALG